MDSFKRVAVMGIMIMTLAGCNQSDSNRESSLNSQLTFNTDRWVNPWVKFWNSYDLNQVDILFLQDDRLTYFSSEKQGALKGIEAVREHHKGFGFVEGGKDQPNRLWLEDIDTTVFESTVVVTAIWFFQRADGTVQRGPVTMVYVQQGNEYRIAHMNFSNYL